MTPPTIPTEAEKVVAGLDDETLSPEDSARDLIERFRSGDCPFCGRDPYHYVDNGVGMERVAVVCCDLGIALFQDGDEQLSRAEGERHEAAHALSGLLALIESQRATIERVERERCDFESKWIEVVGLAAQAEARVAALEAEKAKLRAALEEIASHDCGCVPCTGQCRTGEAAEIELEARMAIASAALSSTEVKNDG